jgi:MFS family permease
VTVESDSSRSTVAATIMASIRDTRVSIGSVFANPALRRIELALAGSEIGGWAYATAVAVWAYGVGGEAAIGIWAAIKFLLMAFASPIGSVLADRLPRKQVLIASDVVRAALVAAAAVCMYVGTSPWLIFVLATIVSLVGCIFRPAQMSWMPSLTNNPEELTAANGAASTLESLAFFVGPAIGAGLVVLIDVETVFFLNALTFLLSALMVSRIVPVGATPDGTDAPGRDGDDPESGVADGAVEAPGALAELTAGFSAIFHDRDLIVITAIVVVQTVIAGAMVVLSVSFAVDILRTGPAGVGFVDSIFGVGAIVGGFFAIARAARNRLASDLAIGTLLWSAPLVLIVLVPRPAVVFAAVILMGLGNPLVDVNMMSLIQRITPERVLGRVFGAVEGALIAGMALGSVAAPFLISRLELRGALIVFAVVVGVPTIALMPYCRRLDGRLVEPAGTKWLRQIPMFTPLRRDTLESLASRLVPESASAGTIILREGDESDRFLVITSGRVEVTQAGRVLRVEETGDHFGEIGLLRDIPRTATITALEDTTLLSLSRADFLTAVGTGEARVAADDIVARRLG